MGSRILLSSRELTFRRYRPWFAVELGISSGILAFFLRSAMLTGGRAWLAASTLGAIALGLQLRRYRVCAVILRGGTLYIRRGMLRSIEYPLPLWRDSPIYRTSFLGGLLDYTTVIFRHGNEYIGMYRVAGAKQLRAEIERVQKALMSLPATWPDSAVRY